MGERVSKHSVYRRVGGIVSGVRGSVSIVCIGGHDWVNHSYEIIEWNFHHDASIMDSN